MLLEVVKTYTIILTNNCYSINNNKIILGEISIFISKNTSENSTQIIFFRT